MRMSEGYVTAIRRTAKRIYFTVGTEEEPYDVWAGIKDTVTLRSC